MSKEQSGPNGLVDRVLNSPKFILLWFLCLALVVVFVGRPIRNVALVCWAYGSSGYFDRGIRALPGKPTRFSNGELAPVGGDVITGFGAFFIIPGGLTGLLVAGLNLYDRRLTRLSKSKECKPDPPDN